MVAAVRNRPRAERTAAAYRRAAEISEQDIVTNKAIGQNGLPLIEAIAQRKKPGERVNVLTHCNAGWPRQSMSALRRADLHGARQRSCDPRFSLVKRGHVTGR